MSALVSVRYCGKHRRFRGKTALMKELGSGGYHQIAVQFDDLLLTDKRGTRMGLGWHVFHRSQFKPRS